MADFFSTQLLECKWRDIGFPITSMRVHGAQSTVPHMQPDRDGARVEATGRQPLRFSASSPLYNNVSRGPHESWDKPYPELHRKLFDAMMNNRTSGTLQHPSLGLFLCKPSTCEADLNASRRDGETLNLEWIETRDEDDVLASVFTSDSPIGAGIRNAIDLDDSISVINIPASAKPTVSFEDAMRSVAGVFDKATLLSKKTFGVIAAISYRLDVISDAVVALQDPQMWPVKESIAKLRASLEALSRAAAKGQKDTLFYVTPAPTTLANLAAKFNNSSTDMIMLNPSLVASPQIPTKTIVRYYVTVR